MSRRMRVFFGGLTALALVGLSLGADSASATTGGCIVPQFAALAYGSEGGGGPIFSFFDQVMLSGDSGVRKQQCGDFLKGCQQTVKLSTNCVQAALAADQKGLQDLCKDSSGSVSDCQKEVSSQYSSFQGFLSGSKATGNDICKACYADCLEGITDECGF